MTEPLRLRVADGRLATLVAVVAGALYFLGFAGFDVWPLSLVSLAPLLFALRGRSLRHAFLLGWLAGTVSMAGGFYWIVSMLRTFSGFPTAVCALFSVLLYAAQGLQFGLLAAFVVWCDRRTITRWLSVPAALCVLELLYPLLFPWYTANSLHVVPVLCQLADTGGPLLVGAMMACTWVACDALVEGFYATRRAQWRALAVPVALWGFALPYGAWRIRQVDVENITAAPLRVGIVQENLGLMEKRFDVGESIDRHLATTRALEARGADLVVWSESAVGALLPTDDVDMHDLGRFRHWDFHVPVLFGALSSRDDRYYNTAFMTDAGGRLRATYDKTYLLAFGEYLPLGETFPQFYEWSPHSGHFTPGARFTAFPLRSRDGHGIGSILPLICYEDILPRFVRSFSNATSPSLFAVILNDAWFGDSQEPWIHFALSKMRSIEHRRDFIRASNSGVSGFVDAAGRVIDHTGTFRRASELATVHLRTRRTLYDVLGDWPGYLAVLGVLGAFAYRRQGAVVAGSSSA